MNRLLVTIAEQDSKIFQLETELKTKKSSLAVSVAEKVKLKERITKFEAVEAEHER